jgi:hypothetical protein
VASDKDKTVVFHHIPKAAGTTLAAIATRQYLPWQTCIIVGDKKAKLAEIKEWPESKRRPIRFYRGHQSIQLLSHLANPIVLTMFRHPLSRVISLYYYARHPKRSRHPMHQLTNRYTVEQFFKQKIDQKWAECSNGQVDSISHVLKLMPRWAAGLGDNQSQIERLKTVLESHIVFGLVEEFDLSLLYFAERLDWSLPLFYTKRNVTAYRREIPAWMEDYILSRNQQDLELYSFAKDVFERRVKNNDLLMSRLISFHDVNRRIGQWFSRTDRLFTLSSKAFGLWRTYF